MFCFDFSIFLLFVFSALEVSAERLSKKESSALFTNILSDALSMSSLVGFFFLAKIFFLTCSVAHLLLVAVCFTR